MFSCFPFHPIKDQRATNHDGMATADGTTACVCVYTYPYIIWQVDDSCRG